MTGIPHTLKNELGDYLKNMENKRREKTNKQIHKIEEMTREVKKKCAAVKAHTSENFGKVKALFDEMEKQGMILADRIIVAHGELAFANEMVERSKTSIKAIKNLLKNQEKDVASKRKTVKRLTKALETGIKKGKSKKKK